MPAKPLYTLLMDMGAERASNLHVATQRFVIHDSI